MPENYHIIEETKFKNGKKYWKYTAYYGHDEFAGNLIVKHRKMGLTILDLKVEVNHRQKGVAKALVNEVINKLGDNDLFIRPRPFQDKPVPKEKLYEIYENLGFVEFGSEGMMVKLTAACW